MNSNVKGFFNIIDNLKYNPPRKNFYLHRLVLFMEGLNFPLKENQILSPKNIYALSKKNNEK